MVQLHALQIELALTDRQTGHLLQRHVLVKLMTRLFIVKTAPFPDAVCVVQLLLTVVRYWR